MEEVYEFLKKAGAYFLATVDGDQPHVRPFGSLNLFEGKIYIQTGKTKDVAKQILANPKAEICAMGEGRSWIRITCTLEADDRIEAQDSMMATFPPEMRGIYHTGPDGNVLCCWMKDATAYLFNGPEPTIIHF